MAGRIEVVPELVEVEGRTRVKLTVKRDDAVLDADMVNPLNPTQRKKVAQRLAERCGDVHAAERIEAAILQCVEIMNAQTEAMRKQQEQQAKADEAPEQVLVEPVRLVRPELFIVDGVVALSVPEVVIRNGQATGRWRLYIRYADGRRSDRDLAERIEVSPGKTVWVHPLPPPPALPVASPWSMTSRKKWIDKSDVTAREVFGKVCEALSEYLEFPGEGEAPAEPSLPGDGSPGGSPSQHLHPAIAILALWTMLTYVYLAWDAVPYLYVSGPAGSGKTRVFELLSRLVFRGFVSSNLSGAALFRTLHERGGTLLMDEAERLNDGAPEVAELRSILLAGYKRGGKASRLESTGENFQMTEFVVYGPKAIACISSLPGPLASRCIPIQMFRSPPDSPKPRRRIDVDPNRWQTLRDELHMLALGELGACAPTLALMDDVCRMSGRHYELWQPILAIAAMVDADGAMELVGRVGAFAKGLIVDGQEEMLPEADLALLRALSVRLQEGIEPTPQMVLNYAKQSQETVLRSATSMSTAIALKRYGVTSRRSNRGRVYPADLLHRLKNVERSYGVDLYTCGKPTSGHVEVRLY